MQCVVVAISDLSSGVFGQNFFVLNRSLIRMEAGGIIEIVIKEASGMPSCFIHLPKRASGRENRKPVYRELLQCYPFAPASPN